MSIRSKTRVALFLFVLGVAASHAQNIGGGVNNPGSSSGTTTITANSTPTSGFTSGDFISTSSNKVQDSGILATANVTGGVVTAISGCQSWTPADESGASLTFTSVSAEYCQYGNMVYAYGTLTYPSTASVSTAAISLPVAVPNQSYAAVQAPSGAGVAAALFIRTVINTSTAEFFNTTSVAQLNSTLSLTTLHFMLIYPAN